MSAYLLVSLHSQALNNPLDNGVKQSTDPVVKKFSEHDWWDKGQGWKNILNNLRLILQPYQFFNLILPWLKVFPVSHLSIGFLTLIALMNRMQVAIPDSSGYEDFLFSSA